MFTVYEAAEMLDISPGRVRQLIGAGVITAQRFGKSLVLTPAEIAKARRRRTKPGRPTEQWKANRAAARKGAK
ncbi:MAG: helix-turn-helix domain-containing protein [Blastocatellia bacterium]|nr:helix-turn-helix domain-containing protein [Blastocatellia bacterium]